jgi:hypothetical protein
MIQCFHTSPEVPIILSALQILKRLFYHIIKTNRILRPFDICSFQFWFEFVLTFFGGSNCFGDPVTGYIWVYNWYSVS